MRLGIRGSVGTRSVAATVERRFYNESLYLGKRLRLPRCIEELPFSFTPCQVLRRGWSDRGRFKGVLRFIAGRRYESNAFAEYFRSYEMRVERRSRRGNLSYLSYRSYLVSFDKRSWTFLPPPPLSLSRFFSLVLSRFSFSFFEIYPCSRSCSLLRLHFLSRGLRIRFSFLLPFPLVGGHFLLFTSLSALLSVPSVVRSLFAAISVDGPQLSGHGILFSCNLLTTFQRGKVMCTGSRPHI